LFSDGANTGKVDPSGISWMGSRVEKRLRQIKNEFVPLKNLHNTSPSEYEFKVKNLYGRLRDAYERLVEECIFHDIINRGVDRVETQKLRYVHLQDALAERFYEGMSKANTHSHDNPAAQTVKAPAPSDFELDMIFIENLIQDLKKEARETENRRPSMKKK
jgi:hypothetical protein